MRMKIFTPAVISVLVLLSAFPVVFASHGTPFNGSLAGTFAIASATPTTTIIGTATGYFEHLGKTAFVARATVTGTSVCGGFSTTEDDTFTAASGDQIFASATGVACPTSNPNMIHVTASATITGGTGRFAHASGSYTIQLTLAFATATTGTLSGTSTGTITS